MKKILFALAFAIVFAGSASTTFAATDCSVDPCGNGDPMAVGMPWGLTGHQTPVVKPGATITDEAGYVDTCPFWYPAGCFDLTKTEYYRKAQIETARQLLALGYSKTNLPFQWKYWGQFVR